MACFERFIEFLNKNAYIQIALQGKSFCGAAKDAFSLIMSNIVRFAIVGRVGAIFQFIGVMMITLAGAFFTYAMLSYVTEFKSLVTSPLLPSIVSGVVCFVVGYLFMIVYGMGIDTILQCFLLDETLAKSTNEEPEHTPEPLRDIMADIA